MPGDPARPGNADHADELSVGGRSRPLRWRWLVLALLAATGAVLAWVASTTGGAAHREPSARPPAAGTGGGGSGPGGAAADGAVFIEHLDRCTSTDHRRRLTVAFGVTNLGSRPVRLLAASPLGTTPQVRLVRLRLGAGPCAADALDRPVRLASAAHTVVAMSFRVGPGCPRASVVAARVLFEVARRLVHADSSTLADLSRLRFTQCP